MARDDPYTTLKAYGNTEAANGLKTAYDEPVFIDDQVFNTSYAPGKTTPAASVPLPPATPQKGVTLPPVGHINIESPAPEPRPDFNMLSPAQRAQMQTQQSAPEPDYATSTTTSTQTTTRSGRPIDKPWLAKRGELFQAQRDIGRAEMESQVKTAEQSEAAIAGTLERMGARSAQLAKERTRIQEQIRAREARIDAATKEVVKAKVDPEHYWNNISTGDKVMHGMAIALGGFLRGWTQGKMQNSALQLYNQAVERDLQAQRRKILQKKEGIKGDENMLAHYYRDLGSLAEAETAYRNTQNAHMRLQLKKIQASGAPALVKANARRVELGLEAQLAQEQHQERVASFAQTVTTRNVQTRKIPMQASSSSGKPPPQAIQTAVGNAVATMDEIISAVAKISTSGYGRVGRHLPDSEAQRIRDMHILPLMVSIAKAKEKGVLTDADFKRYKNMLDRKLMSGNEIIKRLLLIKNQMGNRELRKLQSHAQYYNVTPLYRQLSPYITRQVTTKK